MKKLKVLSDVECMSGTGWYPDDDFEHECPECGEVMKEKKNLFVCDNGHKFKIERGVQYMIRIGDMVSKKTSKQCEKCGVGL
jgi:ribosomal protein S27AE